MIKFILLCMITTGVLLKVDKSSGKEKGKTGDKKLEKEVKGPKDKPNFNHPFFNAKQFIAKYKKNHQRNSIKKLQETFDRECSALSDKELAYSEEDIKIGHEKLIDYMGWARVKNSEDMSEFWAKTKTKIKGFHLLSPMGNAVLLTGQFCFLFACVGIVFVCSFYCFPNGFQNFHSKVKSIIFGGSADEGVGYRGEKAEYYAYPFYKDYKNFLNKRGMSVFCIFGAKFISAGVVVAALVIAFIQIMKLDMTADCGLMKAALDLTKGEEGSYFAEFGLFSNKTLLHRFEIDLKNYSKHSYLANYDVLINKDFEQMGEDIDVSIETFFTKIKDRTVTSCSSSEEVTPEIIVELSEGVNDKVNKEVTEVVKIGSSISKAAVYLRDLTKHKDKRLEEFNAATKEMSTYIDLIVDEIFTIQDQAREFLKSYDSIMAVLSIVAIVWICYTVLQMLPSDSLESCKFPKPVQVNFQLVGAAIMFIFGAYLFYDSQMIIQGCITGNKLLGDTKHMKHFLGAENEKWIEVCLDESGSGELEDLIPRERKSEFFAGMDVLRGFSMDLSKYLSKITNFKLNSTSNYDKLIRSYRYHHHNLLEKHPVHSYNNVITKINDEIKCTQLSFRLSSHSCQTKFSGSTVLSKWTDTVKSLKDLDLENKATCIVLPLMNPPIQPEEFVKFVKNHDCIQKGLEKTSKKHEKFILEKNPNKLFSGLSTCLASHDSFMSEMEDYFNVVVQRIEILNKNLFGAEKSYNHLRGEFNHSLVEYNQRGKDVEKILSCRGIRKTARMVLGGFCYASHGLRGGLSGMHRDINQKIGFGAWFWFWVSGIGLVMITISNFLEGLLDKTVLRKYKELNDQKKKERTDRIFETEMGPI